MNVSNSFEGDTRRHSAGLENEGGKGRKSVILSRLPLEKTGCIPQLRKTRCGVAQNYPIPLGTNSAVFLDFPHGQPYFCS